MSAEEINQTLGEARILLNPNQFESLKQAHLKGRTERNEPGKVHTTWVLLNDGGLAFRYHFTDVVIFYPDHIELNTSGFYTQTTKQRINMALGYVGVPAYVKQENRDWYFKKYSVDTKIPFLDGMTLDYNGNVIRHEVTR